MTQPTADALLARITPTADVAALAGCDVVVEAVFEDTALKQQRVRRDRAARRAPDALLASNTSQIPIADARRRPCRGPPDFVGLHFFSPVEKMPLVEVCGAEDLAADARARDRLRAAAPLHAARRDATAAASSRRASSCSSSAEAFALVLEGAPPAAIERAATSAGYPVGPLQLADELNLRTARKVLRRRGRPSDGAHPGFALLDLHARRDDRAGRLPAGASTTTTRAAAASGSGRASAPRIAKGCAAIPVADMHDRMMCLQALDAVRCFDEGVIASHATANVASIRAIGFPAWTRRRRAVRRSVRGRHARLRRALPRARRAYGERFAPPASLVASPSAARRSDHEHATDAVRSRMPSASTGKSGPTTSRSSSAIAASVMPSSTPSRMASPARFGRSGYGRTIGSGFSTRTRTNTFRSSSEPASSTR